MGAAIAMNLIESGHDVHVFNRSPARAEPLRKAGASVAESPAEAAQSAEVVFTMVADDAAHTSVTFGDAGIAAGLKRGALHISMSTISVACAQDSAARYREAGLGFVSAPVFGRPDAAAARKLFIMAAGADEYLEVAVPLLEQLGQSVGIVGSDPSQANLVKLMPVGPSVIYIQWRCGGEMVGSAKVFLVLSKREAALVEDASPAELPLQCACRAA
jgi:3-hydroxyisobutyrate dehydrogenase-like beta-hydroxyacid dehydrogenase